MRADFDISVIRILLTKRRLVSSSVVRELPGKADQCPHKNQPAELALRGWRTALSKILKLTEPTWPCPSQCSSNSFCSTALLFFMLPSQQFSTIVLVSKSRSVLNFAVQSCCASRLSEFSGFQGLCEAQLKTTSACTRAVFSPRQDSGRPLRTTLGLRRDALPV